MRSRLFSVFALAWLAGGVAAAFPVPAQRIELPPDERVPELVVRMLAAPGPDWGVVKLNAPEAWLKTKGKGVRVCVLDTGIDANHPDLKANIKSTADLKDFTGSASGYTDRQGHGTHCAGSVLASGDLPGVAPEATLMVGKVLDDRGSGAVTWIAAGIDWAVANGADVISMSLGGASQDAYIPPALARAEAAGVIVVAAAGNSGPREGTVGYPGGYKECVCVGAVDINLNAASFSSRGPAVYVAGPGVKIRSLAPGGQYADMSGTSMATPNVAGEAALFVAAHPEIPKKERPAKFRAALAAACKDLGPAGRDTAYGFGFPDAAKLVAGSTTPPPIEPPPVVPKGWSGTITYTYDRGQLVDVKPVLKP